MSKVLSLLILLFVSISLTDAGYEAPYYAPNSPESIAPWLPEMLGDYEDYVMSLMEETHTPGSAIAIVKDGQILMSKGFGTRAATSTQTVDEHTVFRLGSVSKGFAPILTGLLVEDGILQWDDKVTKYLPDFYLSEKENTDSLTIRHLLSHTTSLPKHAYTNLIEEGYTFDEMVEELKTVALIGKVGRYYSYQNVVYSLISDIVEVATGKTYSELMEERVFQPLEMLHASANCDDFMNGENIAFPHKNRGHKCVPTDILENYYTVVPAAGVNASISDMGKWLKAMLGYNAHFIQDSTLAEVFEPVIRTPRRNRQFAHWKYMKRAYYAMGWRVFNFPNEQLVYHGGYVNGYKTEIAFLPNKKLGIAILSNAPTRFSYQALPIFFKMMEDYERAYGEI